MISIKKANDLAQKDERVSNTRSFWASFNLDTLEPKHIADTLGAYGALAPAAFAVAGRVGLAAVMQSIEDEGWRFVAFVRLMPVLPYNLLNYALGLTRIRLSQFTAATLVFMKPIDVAYSYLGYAGYQALSGEACALRSALIGVAVFVTLLFVPAFVRRHRRRLSSSQP